MEERVTELEMRFMHQENTIQELNDAICGQEQRIMLLEREVVRLRELLMAMTPSINRAPDEEEPPPHY